MWVALSERDSMPDFDGSYCVVATRETVLDEALLREATPSELVKEMEILRSTIGFSEMSATDLLFHARNRAELKIQKSAEYVECVSVDRLFGHVFFAIFGTMLLIVFSLVCRWVAHGFTR